MKKSFIGIMGIVVWVFYFYLLLKIEDKVTLGLLSGIVIGITITGVIFVIREQGRN